MARVLTHAHSCGVCRVLSMKAVRRLIEGDLGLEKKQLDEQKDVVTALVDQVRTAAAGVACQLSKPPSWSAVEFQLAGACSCSTSQMSALLCTCYICQHCCTICERRHLLLAYAALQRYWLIAFCSCGTADAVSASIATNSNGIHLHQSCPVAQVQLFDLISVVTPPYVACRSCSRRARQPQSSRMPPSQSRKRQQQQQQLQRTKPVGRSAASSSRLMQPKMTLMRHAGSSRQRRQASLQARWVGQTKGGCADSGMMLVAATLASMAG